MTKKHWLSIAFLVLMINPRAIGSNPLVLVGTMLGVKNQACDIRGMFSDTVSLFNEDNKMLPGGDGFLSTNSNPGKLSRIIGYLGSEIGPKLISTEKLRSHCLSSSLLHRRKKRGLFSSIGNIIGKTIKGVGKVFDNTGDIICGNVGAKRLEGKVDQLGSRISQGFLHMGNQVNKANVALDSLQCMMAGGMEYWSEIHDGQAELSDLVQTRTADIQSSVSRVTNLVDQRTTSIKNDISKVHSLVNDRTVKIQNSVNHLTGLVDVRTENIQNSVNHLTGVVNHRTSRIQHGVNVLTDLVNVRTTNIHNSVNTLTGLVDDRTVQIRQDVAIVGNFVDDRTRQIIQGVTSVHDLVHVRTNDIQLGIQEATDLVDARTRSIQKGIVKLSGQIDDVTMIIDYGIFELSKQADRNAQQLVYGLDNLTSIVEKRTELIDQGIAEMKALMEDKIDDVEKGVLNVTTLVNNRTLDIQNQITNLSEIALNETAAIQNAVADVRQIVLDLGQVMSDEMAKMNNKLGNITSELRSVIANKLREMNLQESENKLSLIQHNALTYFENPNNYNRHLIQKTCDGFDPMLVLLEISNNFGKNRRIKEFYVDMQNSAEQVNEALSFLESLVYSASLAIFHCMTTNEVYMRAGEQEQRLISQDKAVELNEKLNNLTMGLSELRFSELVRQITAENLYENEISNFLRTNGKNSNEEIARHLQGQLDQRFGFVGVHFNVVSLNITTSTSSSQFENNRVKSRVQISPNPRSQNDPWQGSVWQTFADGNRLAFVTWSLCDSVHWLSTSATIAEEEDNSQQTITLNFHLGPMNVVDGDGFSTLSYIASAPTPASHFEQRICPNSDRGYRKYTLRVGKCEQVQRIRRIHPSRCDSGSICPLVMESPNSLSTLLFNTGHNSLELYFQAQKGKTR